MSGAIERTQAYLDLRKQVGLENLGDHIARLTLGAKVAVLLAADVLDLIEHIHKQDGIINAIKDYCETDVQSLGTLDNEFVQGRISALTGVLRLISTKKESHEETVD